MGGEGPWGARCGVWAERAGATNARVTPVNRPQPFRLSAGLQACAPAQTEGLCRLGAGLQAHAARMHANEAGMPATGHRSQIQIHSNSSACFARWAEVLTPRPPAPLLAPWQRQRIPRKHVGHALRLQGTQRELPALGCEAPAVGLQAARGYFSLAHGVCGTEGSPDFLG